MKLSASFSSGDRIISLIGMAKNAGKTVVLNQLILEAFEAGQTIGITSIGRDGERQDLVTETPKPRIYAYEGTQIATAEGLLGLCEAGLEILEVTNIGTALGKIIIARVRHAGYVQIAGPGFNRDIRRVAEKMLAFGVCRVYIDGALDRTSSASPAIADCAVLSTGAVLSRDMKRVIQETSHRMMLFQLPQIADETLSKSLHQALSEHAVVLVNDQDTKYAIHHLEMKTALGNGQRISDAMTEETVYVAISGSLVFSTIKDAILQIKNPEKVVWIVQDATKLFVDEKEWLQVRRWGVKIEVLKPLKLVALTVNPYAPSGYFFNPEQFLQEMSRSAQGLTVVDVVYGGWQCTI
jgi:hypothetical protein